MTSLSRRQLLRSTGVASLAAGAIAFDRAPAAHAAGTEADPSFDGLVNDRGGQLFNVTNPAYGAKADAVRAVAGGSISARSKRFTRTTSSAGFVLADLGKVLTVQGAGVGGTVLTGTIVAVLGATTVKLSCAAATTVTDAGFAYGTDDTAAILAAMAAAGDTGTLYLPAGTYLLTGAANGGKPIVHTGRGGIRGRGGMYRHTAGSPPGANTVLLLGDATAGLVTLRCARYEGFLCDGNHIAQAPLQVGLVNGGGVTAAAAHASFSDVRVARSAGTGWVISGARHCSFYDCASADNAVDGFRIDGGSYGLDFFQLSEHGNLRHGVSGGRSLTAPGGGLEPTRGIRLRGARFERGSASRAGISKVHLRGAVDWRFVDATIDGVHGSGPAVDLDQSSGYGIDLSGSLVHAATTGGVPGVACIRVSGVAPADAEGTFVKTDECTFAEGDTSLHLAEHPGAFRQAAFGGWNDRTVNGPSGAAGLPAVETMLTGRTAQWRDAVVVSPWSGSVRYRLMAEGWIRLEGAVGYVGPGSGPAFTLPVGYRPDGSDRLVVAAASTGPTVVSIATTGAVGPGGGVAPGATVSLDGVTFPIGGS